MKHSTKSLTEAAGRALARIWDDPAPLVAAPAPAGPPSSLLRSRTSAKLLCSLRSTSRTLFGTETLQINDGTLARVRDETRRKCNGIPNQRRTRSH